MQPGHMSIVIDHAQPRPVAPDCVIAARGAELAGVLVDTWIDPVTATVMLEPAMVNAQWWSSNTGRFAKPTTADYAFSSSADWRVVVLFPGAGAYMACDNAASAWARTAAAMGINRPVFVSTFLYSGGDARELLRFGWHDTVTDATNAAVAIGAILYTSGDLEVYEAGVRTGVYRLSAAARQNELLNLMLIPARGRELLVVTPEGEGFTHVRQALAEALTPGVITPAARFFVAFPSSAKTALVQFGPLQFPTSGTATSPLYSLGQAPITGQSITSWSNPVFTSVTNAAVYGYRAGAGSTDVTAVELLDENNAPFVVDGTRDRAAIRVTLTGDGAYTPFVYGALVLFEALYDDTSAAEEQEITPYVTSLELVVPDHPWGANLLLTIRGDARELIDDLEAQPWRPVRLSCGDTVVFDGILAPPRYAASTTAVTESVTVECVSRTAFLEQYLFTQRLPLDGWALSSPIAHGWSAVAWIATSAGLEPTQLELSDLGYALGQVPDERSDTWNVVADVGDTAAQVLERLHGLASHVFMGEHPVGSRPGFWFLAPDDLPSGPVITLYREPGDAVAMGGHAPEEAYQYCYGEFVRQPLELEATEIRATGIDPRTGAIVQAVWRDSAAADPTLPPSARPANWTGFPLPLGVAAREITTTDIAAAVAEYLAEIAAGTIREEGEFVTGAWLWHDTYGDPAPVWRGDVVALEGYGLVRIASVRVVTQVDADGAIDHIDCRYTFGAARGVGGEGLAQISELERARLIARGVARLDPRPLIATRAPRVTDV